MTEREFSIVEAIERHNGWYREAGTYWNLAEFASQEDRAAFIAECKANGCPTRSEGRNEQTGAFYTHYHDSSDEESQY
jgi:hypothetical protein